MPSSTPFIGFHQHYLSTFINTTYRSSSTSFIGFHQHHLLVFINTIYWSLSTSSFYFHHRFWAYGFLSASFWNLTSSYIQSKRGPLTPETRQHVNNTKTRYGGIGSEQFGWTTKSGSIEQSETGRPARLNFYIRPDTTLSLR